LQGFQACEAREPGIEIDGRETPIHHPAAVPAPASMDP